MTADEVKQSYMFRIIKRALMKQYPWITNVEVNEEEFDNYFRVIFLNVFIDPYILGEEYGWEVARWVEPGYNSSSVGLFLKDRHPQFSELNDEVNNFIWSVINSPAIPDELKLPKPKDDFSVGDYISIK